MRTVARWTFLAFTVIFTMVVYAGAPQGSTKRHWTVITTETLRVLREGKSEFVLVNVLPKIIHDQMHIPGSVNIPLGVVSTSRDLPKDKNTLVVFYCMGRQCRYSPKAADIAHDMGYTNLRVYRDGILGWIRDGLPFDSLVTYPKVNVPLISAADLAVDPQAWLLDLRPIDHFSRGHIKGSTNIDLEVLHKQIHHIPRDRRVVLVDHKGKLTLTVGRYLASQGITNVFRLDGGLNAWAKWDLPLEKSIGGAVTNSPRSAATGQLLE
jgi:rhodanese-related sulfurtransferase